MYLRICFLLPKLSSIARKGSDKQIMEERISRKETTLSFITFSKIDLFMVWISVSSHGCLKVSPFNPKSPVVLYGIRRKMAWSRVWLLIDIIYMIYLRAVLTRMIIIQIPAPYNCTPCLPFCLSPVVKSSSLGQTFLFILKSDFSLGTNILLCY